MKIFQHRGAAVGLILLGLFLLLALLAPWIAPFDPLAQPDIVNETLRGPSGKHWFGTDELSRDIFSRVLYGARISLSIGLLAVLISVSVGTLVGALAGFFGGWVDTVLMRLVDILLALPRLVLLLAVVGLWPGDTSYALIILVLGLTGWMSTSRLVRAEVLSLRERDFIQAGRSLGYSSGRLIFKHILPNCMGVILVSASLGVGTTILLESAISFLGLGLAPPAPSWGNLVAEGRLVLESAPWVAVFPGLAIVAVVLAVNLLGDGLRDLYDPKGRG